MRTLSSKVTRNAPSGFGRAFFTWPLIPDTVRILAPSNYVTSKEEENVSRTNAVFLEILYGTPVNLSFFTTFIERSMSSTTLVAVTLKLRVSPESELNVQKPVLGGETGP